MPADSAVPGSEQGGGKFDSEVMFAVSADSAVPDWESWGSELGSEVMIAVSADSAVPCQELWGRRWGSVETAAADWAVSGEDMSLLLHSVDSVSCWVVCGDWWGGDSDTPDGDQPGSCSASQSPLPELVCEDWQRGDSETLAGDQPDSCSAVNRFSLPLVPAQACPPPPSLLLPPTSLPPSIPKAGTSLRLPATFSPSSSILVNLTGENFEQSSSSSEPDSASSDP